MMGWDYMSNGWMGGWMWIPMILVVALLILGTIAVARGHQRGEGALREGRILCVPAGTSHNVINTGEDALQLFTVYTPPQHPAGTIHATKAEAQAGEAAEAQVSEPISAWP